MTLLQPSKKNFIEKWIEYFKKVHAQTFMKNPVYVIEIGETKIKTGWKDEEKEDCVTFNGTLYDSIPSIDWFGTRSIFVVKGIRKPINFRHYYEMFEKPDTPQKKIALDGKLANLKMNVRLGAELSKLAGEKDLSYYIQIGIFVCVVFIAAAQMDIIHTPQMVQMQNGFAQVINVTRGGT